MENIFIIKKIYNTISIFSKTFSALLPSTAFKVTFIKTSNPPSADKNNSCAAERLYTHDALSLIHFSSITDRLFSTYTRFSALSILTIFLDKCQMKSFEDINILIKVKVFCLKTFFWKKLLFEKMFWKIRIKKLLFETKKLFCWKSNFVWEKNFFLIFFFEKKFFEKKFKK